MDTQRLFSRIAAGTIWITGNVVPREVATFSGQCTDSQSVPSQYGQGYGSLPRTVGCKDADGHETEAIGANWEWKPRRGWAGVQPPPEAKSIEEVEQPSQHEVHNLHPPPVTEREVDPQTETRARVVLNEYDNKK